MRSGAENSEVSLPGEVAVAVTNVPTGRGVEVASDELAGSGGALDVNADLAVGDDVSVAGGGAADGVIGGGGDEDAELGVAEGGCAVGGNADQVAQQLVVVGRAAEVDADIVAGD